MADNVTIPATGSGTATPVIAADDVAGVQYQRVKLVDGTADSVALIPGDATFGLAADIKRSVGLSIAPVTTGGASLHHRVATADTNAVNIKASAGQVYGWNIFNNALYPIYVKFHNSAGTPTAGTGVVHTIAVQAGRERDIWLDVGLPFATGIAMTIVKDITDAGATAVALSDCVVDIYFK